VRYARFALTRDQDMREIVAILIISLGSVNQVVTAESTDAGAFERQDEAEKKVRELLPSLESLEDKYTNDIEIQLGLGVLYSRYATSERFSEKAGEQWQKVLKIDPNNHSAQTAFVKGVGRGATARRAYFLGRLEMRIENAKKSNVKQLTLSRSSPLFPLLRGEAGESFVTITFEAARKELRVLLDNELRSAITMAAQAQKREPNNAFYDYIKAHLYFELGQREIALKETRNGARKKYLNTYFTEMRGATRKVLAAIDFPEEMRPYILDMYEPFGDFIRGEIWQKQLVPLAKGYQEQGKAQHVQDISTLVLGISKQIRAEPMPYESFFNQSFAQSLEKWAQEHSGAVSANTAQQEYEDSPEAVSRGVIYALFAGACSILLVAYILLRRKSTSRWGK